MREHLKITLSMFGNPTKPGVRSLTTTIISDTPQNRQAMRELLQWLQENDPANQRQLLACEERLA